MKDQITSPEDTLIAIGSNINPAENLQAALNLLSETVKISRLASIWQTPAVGSQGPDYLNTAILITDPPLLNILKNDILSRVEHSLGRIRTDDKNADRPIDLDVLIYRGVCLDNDLWEQAHITIPAAELLPVYMNHSTGESLSALSNRLWKKVNFILRDDLDISF